MKILFHGFCHTHIYSLYRKVLQKLEQLEIAGCIEENKEMGKAAQESLAICLDGGSYEEWLNKDIDIVAVGDKYGERGETVIKALRAGKHVIADKPLCTRLEELEEIELLVKQNNVKVACMLELRNMPTINRARELLRAGKLGRVRNISFTGQHCIDYKHRPSWYFEESMHGGTINDLAIHGVDIVRDITGLEIEKLDGVRTWNAYAVKNPEFKDCAVFMARLSNGAELLADVSYSAPSQVFTMPTYWNFEIWCERGYMTFNLADNYVKVYEEEIPKMQSYEGIVEDKDYLTEFLKEISEGSDTLTQSVIASTRATLLIQKAADAQNDK